MKEFVNLPMPANPLQVLHILETRQFAGTEAHVLTLMQNLDPDTASASLLCLRGSPLHERALKAGLNCMTAPSMKDFIRLLRSRPFSILHAHDGQAKVKAVLGAQMAMFQGQIVATQHFLSPASTQRTGWKKALSALLHRILNRRVSMTIAVSQAVRDAALSRTEVPASRITVIHNGIAAPPASVPSRLTQTLQGLNIPSSAPIVCAVARLEKEKGLTYLLNAMPQVLSRMPDTRFVIVGDGAERSALEAEAIKLRVDRSVIFTGFRSDVFDLVACCHVFVLPSPAEPFGLSILEAMAFAKPVVAIRSGGPVEIVQDGETGLLAAPADAQSLSGCMLSLLLDAPRAAIMGQSGQRRLHAFFSAETMARSTEAVYQKLDRRR